MALHAIYVYFIPPILYPHILLALMVLCRIQCYIIPSLNAALCDRATILAVLCCYFLHEDLYDPKTNVV